MLLRRLTTLMRNNLTALEALNHSSFAKMADRDRCGPGPEPSSLRVLCRLLPFCLNAVDADALCGGCS